MRPARGAALAALCTAALAACDYDHAELRGAPPAAATDRAVLATTLQPGAPYAPGLPLPYREDSVAVWEGMRLYNWYNCNGCHANGGGGIGPPFGDREWIYGHTPAQILASILEGRPDGMPAYAGRLSAQEALRIVAYVRSLAGLTERRDDMWPVRGRHMLGATELGPVGREDVP